MEAATALRGPEAPGGGEPEPASGAASLGASHDPRPGDQEEDQQDREASSSGQLQGETPPLPGLLPSPTLPSAPVVMEGWGSPLPRLGYRLGSSMSFASHPSPSRLSEVYTTPFP